MYGTSVGKIAISQNLNYHGNTVTNFNVIWSSSSHRLPIFLYTSCDSYMLTQVYIETIALLNMGMKFVASQDRYVLPHMQLYQNRLGLIHM